MNPSTIPARIQVNGDLEHALKQLKFGGAPTLAALRRRQAFVGPSETARRKRQRSIAKARRRR